MNLSLGRCKECHHRCLIEKQQNCDVGACLARACPSSKRPVPEHGIDLMKCWLKLVVACGLYTANLNNQPLVSYRCLAVTWSTSTRAIRHFAKILNRFSIYTVASYCWIEKEERKVVHTGVCKRFAMLHHTLRS